MSGNFIVESTNQIIKKPFCLNTSGEIYFFIVQDLSNNFLFVLALIICCKYISSWNKTTQRQVFK